MAFTEDEDTLLIENIKTTQVYAKHKDYDNSVYKGTVWPEISMKLGKSVKQCKKRWKIIKDSYLKGNNDIFQYLDLTFLDETPEEISSLKNNEGEKIIKEVNDMIHGFSQQCIDHEDEVLTLESPAVIQNSSSTGNVISKLLETNLKDTLVFHPIKKNLMDNPNFTMKPANQPEIVSVPDEDDKANNVSLDETVASIPYYKEKINLLREKNSILYSLLDQIIVLNKKSDIVSSLELFFNSISFDIYDLPTYVIDDIKLKVMHIIKNKKDSISTISNNLHDTTHGTSIPQAERDQITTENNQPPIYRLNAIKSLDLFFKSLILELQTLDASVMEEIKIQISSMVTQVKRDFFSPQQNQRNIPPPAQAPAPPPLIPVIPIPDSSSCVTYVNNHYFH